MGFEAALDLAGSMAISLWTGQLVKFGNTNFALTLCVPLTARRIPESAAGGVAR